MQALEVRHGRLPRNGEQKAEWSENDDACYGTIGQCLGPCYRVQAMRHKTGRGLWKALHGLFDPLDDPWIGSSKEREFYVGLHMEDGESPTRWFQRVYTLAEQSKSSRMGIEDDMVLEKFLSGLTQEHALLRTIMGARIHEDNHKPKEERTMTLDQVMRQLMISEAMLDRNAEEDQSKEPPQRNRNRRRKPKYKN